MSKCKGGHPDWRQHRKTDLRQRHHRSARDRSVQRFHLRRRQSVGPPRHSYPLARGVILKRKLQASLPGISTAAPHDMANFAMASAWMPAQSMSGNSVSRSLKASVRSVPPSMIASTPDSLSNFLLTAAKTAR